MASKAAKVATAISPVEFDARSKLAKALWIVSLGDSRSTDPKRLQAEFDMVKNEWLGKASTLKKTLDLLGYQLTQK